MTEERSSEPNGKSKRKRHKQKKREKQSDTNR